MCAENTHVQAWIPDGVIKEMCPEEFHKFKTLKNEIAKKLTRWEILIYFEGEEDYVPIDEGGHLTEEEYNILIDSPLKNYYRQLIKVFKEKTGIELTVLNSYANNITMLDKGEKPEVFNQPSSMVWVTSDIDVFKLENTSARVFKYDWCD